MPDSNQHWVPKFLIKNFIDSDGRTFSFNIKSDKIKKVPPKHAASSPGYYDFCIDGRQVSFEDEFERIETKSAPIIRRIVGSHSIGSLADSERASLARFISAQSFRTDAFYKGLQLGVSRADFGHMFNKLWRSDFLVVSELERRKWILLLIDNDEVFYLGDQPVVLQHTENPSSSKPLGFDVVGVEVFLPLSPKCALYIPCTSICNEILSGYETAAFYHREIRRAALQHRSFSGNDRQLLQLSQRTMQSSNAFYEAVTRGAPVVAK